MSSPEMKPLVLGKITGAIYTFEKAQDELPAHTHGDDDKHIVICARGTVLIIGPNVSQRLSAGGVASIAPGVEHAIVALEDNSRAINIVY